MNKGAILNWMHWNFFDGWRGRRHRYSQCGEQPVAPGVRSISPVTFAEDTAPINCCGLAQFISKSGWLAAGTPIPIGLADRCFQRRKLYDLAWVSHR